MKTPRLLLASLLAMSITAPAGAVPVRPSAPQLPLGLRKLPPDMAVFAHVRVGDLWEHPKAKALRDALGDHFAEFDEEIRSEFGLSIADMDTLTLMASPPGDQFREQFGVIITTKQEIDRRAVLGAWGEKPEPREAEAIPDVVKVERYQPRVIRFLSPKSFSVMSEGLDAQYQELKPIRIDGREPEVIRLAADKKHAAVVWVNLPVLRAFTEGEMAQVQELLPFLPLIRSRTGMITLRADGELAVDAHVRAAGGEGAQVEEAAKALLAMIDEMFHQEEARQQRQGARADPLESLTIERMRALIKSVKLERQGTIITAKGRIEIDDALVAQLKEGLEKAKLTRVPARRANNLKQIGLALHSYHDAYGHFPPAVVTDPQGKPLYSWRVAILPFIEQENIYRQLKLDEPWDSKHNKELLKTMPEVFATPGVSKPGDAKTHVRVFAGDAAGFGDANAKRGLGRDFPDGTSNTIMAVEAEEAVEWAKPQPLEYDPKKPLPKLYFDNLGRCGVVLFDGSVRVIPKGVDPVMLRRLITRNDGEVVVWPN